MLQRYEINRRVKWLTVLNFLLATYIVYTMNSIVVSYFTSEAAAQEEAPFSIRIVANSNKEQDQQQKDIVAEGIYSLIESKQLYNITLEEAAQEIYSFTEINYPHITKEISVGQHIIPPKLVDNRLYPQEKKPSIVVTLGSGRGDNWFCTVFPHTCEPEFEEEEAEEQTEEEQREWLIHILWEKIID